TSTEKPDTEATENDSTFFEETTLEVIDSAAVWALVGDTTGMECDTLCAKFEAALAQLQAEAAATAEEVAEEVEATVEE
ncbi:MAG: hypothetical protein K2J86_10055, partial [Prevotella sp.]|nr:hypothetical protein [Prevotella sp.]